MERINAKSPLLPDALEDGVVGFEVVGAAVGFLVGLGVGLLEIGATGALVTGAMVTGAFDGSITLGGNNTSSMTWMIPFWARTFGSVTVALFTIKVVMESNVTEIVSPAVVV